MGFTENTFDTPIYNEEEKEPQKVIIISCEGSNTEPEYFETIKHKLYKDISVLLEIEIVPKKSHASDPKSIVCNLDEYIEEKYGYQGEHDEMWVVLDREKVQSRKKNILEMIPICQEKNYHIAITNPLFEFWLLMHITDIRTYNYIDLYNNEKVNTVRRFIDKELSNKLTNGYNKQKNKFNKNIVTKENILRAIEQEKNFEREVENIIDNLGSNVGSLVSKILNIQ